MNIFSNSATAPENTTTITNISLIIIIIIILAISLTELIASLTARYGLLSGCYIGDGVQVRKVAVNILNKHVVNCSLLVGRGANI
jgi:hypothetical protein